MVGGYRRPEHSIRDDANEQEDRDHNRRNKVFHRLSFIKTNRSQDGGECLPPRGQDRRTTSSRANISCPLHRSARNRARPPARVPAKARPIAGDGQAVRWLRSTDGHPSEHRRERLSRHSLRAMRRCRGTGPGWSGSAVPYRPAAAGWSRAPGSRTSPARLVRRAPPHGHCPAPTVAASLPCTSIMSLASFKSLESSIITVASSIAVLNAGGENGRGDRPSRLCGEAMPFPPR